MFLIKRLKRISELEKTPATNNKWSEHEVKPQLQTPLFYLDLCDTFCFEKWLPGRSKQWKAISLGTKGLGTEEGFF